MSFKKQMLFIYLERRAGGRSRPSFHVILVHEAEHTGRVLKEGDIRYFGRSRWVGWGCS